MPFFFAALACGYDLTFLLEIFGNLEPGAFSVDGRVFRVASAGVPVASITRFVIVADGFRDGIVIYVHQRRISHIVATRSMAGRRAFIAATAQQARGFLPPFLRLASDDTTGQLIVPSGRVTDLYDARDNWDTLLGRSMDATTTAIVHGRLVMPLRGWPTACIHGRNHPSWENNPAAQAALGPTLANWLYTGKLELVFPGDFVPIIVEPAGAVDKSSPPGFRLITDARLGNHIYSEWGSVYHTADDAALGLAQFDFFFCTDIADAYHTGAFAGCGQGIVTEQMT
jgi:hypothetical protein